MKRFSALAGLVVVVALALPLSGGPSRRFDRGFAFNARQHNVGVRSGPVTIESYVIRRWPSPDDFRDGERDLNETHTCRIEFTYSNRDLDEDWKVRYRIEVKGQGNVYARLEKTETLDKGKVHDRHDFGIKLRTHEYRRAETMDISFEVWRDD